MGDDEHLVLLPFMAHGHLTPFLALAELICRRRPSAAVTIVNTPLNIATLRHSLPPTSPIHLRELPFSPSSFGLPADGETSAVLPFHLFINLMQASESLRPDLELLLAELSPPPTCIIADNFFGWTVEVARNLGIFHAVFYTSGAYGQAAYYSLWRHLPHREIADEDFKLPDFPDITVRRSGLPRHLLLADGKDEWSVFLCGQMNHCFNSNAALINSTEKLDSKGLPMLRHISGLTIYPIGPLLRPTTSANRDASFCIEWLEEQDKGSVLYISFGSQNSITAAQMMELAAGIEASQRPFAWVIRPPIGFNINAKFREEWLPEGFESRMKEMNRGLLIKGWAPQMEILSHRSTGAFLSHCGWNSVLESLSRGVPIIGWPLSGDQLYNSTMLESELGACVELTRGTNGAVEQRRVKEVVAEVLGETERGKEIRRRAKAAAETLAAAWNEEDTKGKGSSARAIDEFFHEMAGFRCGISSQS